MQKNKRDYESVLKSTRSIHFILKPIEDGFDNLQELPPAKQLYDNLFLIPGRLSLHKFEAKISERWNGSYQGDSLSIRTTTAFRSICEQYEKDEEWKLVEPPRAFTWDPENKKYFDDLNIKTEERDTYYTSVHYIVKPNNNKTSATCEIQVRTLFEEIWGEIDHTINYPNPTERIACKEQLRVLSKLVATGTRLADSIFRTFEENENKELKAQLKK